MRVKLTIDVFQALFSCVGALFLVVLDGKGEIDLVLGDLLVYAGQGLGGGDGVG